MGKTHSGVKAPRSWQSQMLVVLFYLSQSSLPALMKMPEKLIGDRAYDSDPLDERLAQMGVEMIAPHYQSNRKRKKHRMEESSEDTIEDGKQSDSLHGCLTIEDV